VAVHRLSKTQARQIAVRAQLLDANRPTDFLDMVGHLTMLQLDPTAAVAPSADLVSWSRLGEAYRPEHLVTALEEDRTLYEVRAIIRPTADLPLHVAAMQAWPFSTEDKKRWAAPGPIGHRWLDANASFREDVLNLLREKGPLLSRDIPDTSTVPWESTGWTGNRNVTQMLEFLSARGEIATTRRQGRQRVWDLAERVYPPVDDPVPLDEARRVMAARRLKALGIARPDTPGVTGERFVEEVEGEPAEVEGTDGEWVVYPAARGEPFEGRTALLSPFDRLIHDRVRAQELFDFEYILEMYKPKDKRRWGYFALPILHNDRLVGKLDATADRKSGVMRVHAIHEDTRFTKAMAAGVRAEIESLASWIGLDDIDYEGD
jgi:uncharacterized protein